MNQPNLPNATQTNAFFKTGSRYNFEYSLSKISEEKKKIKVKESKNPFQFFFFLIACITSFKSSERTVIFAPSSAFALSVRLYSISLFY